MMQALLEQAAILLQEFDLMMIDLIIAAIVLIFILALIASAIKIVPEYQRLVIFRLGRAIAVKGPGLVIIWPIIDKAMVVDLREQFIEVTHQTCITKDNAPVDIDFLIYYKVIDPMKSVVEVANFEGAAVGLATTTLRAVVGDIDLDHVLAQREYINQVLRTKLDEVTERWGVKITAVEIREIIPPKPVQDAMIKQMSAERARRAMVTEAEGKKESAIRVAEGEKQAAILRAEGEKQAAILRAEGIATALKTVNEVATKLDERTLLLQYFEVLNKVAAAPSTKIVLPLEVFSAIKPLERVTQLFKKAEKSQD